MNDSKLLCKHVDIVWDDVTLAVNFNLKLLWDTHECILKMLNVLKHFKIIPKLGYIEKKYAHALFLVSGTEKLFTSTPSHLRKEKTKLRIGERA